MDAIQSLPDKSNFENGLTRVSPFEFVTSHNISKVYPLVKQGEDVSTSEGKWVVEGFASTTDLDSQDHTITKEAIEQGALSLQEYTTLLFNHDPNRPIGHIEKAEAQDGKLFIKAIISPSEPHIWKKIQDGTLSKFSVFGKIIDAEEGELDSKSILVIKSMELYEVSIVSVPANAAAKAIAWYVEKAFMAIKGVETGFSPQALVPQSWLSKDNQMVKQEENDKNNLSLVPQSWLSKEVKQENSKKSPSMKQEKGTPMAKNDNLEQALNFLKNALEEADEESKQQLESQIAALESLQKGEGPMDNDPENMKRRGRVGSGNMGVNTFPTNFPPNTKKVSVGDEADLSLQGDEEKEEMSFMDSLEMALKGLQDASPEFADEDKAIAQRVVQWIEAKIADSVSTPSSPGVASRTARASVTNSDAFTKAINELKQVASGVVQTAQSGEQTLDEMREIQKNVNETAQALLAVAQNLTTTSLRKGQGPAEDTDERVNNDSDSMQDMAKAVGVDVFKEMSPYDKLRLYLNRGAVGH